MLTRRNRSRHAKKKEMQLQMYAERLLEGEEAQRITRHTQRFKRQTIYNIAIVVFNYRVWVSITTTFKYGTTS